MSFDVPRGNGDDSRAARLAFLAATFMSEGSPLPTSRILELFYADAASPQAAAKAFSRDREALAELGVGIVPHGGRGEERSWSIDPASLAGEDALGPQDAIVLNMACQPLLEEPGFPLLEDLRFALAKVDQNFYDAQRAVELRGEPASKTESTINSCIKQGCALKISYRNASGATSAGTYAPLGTFSFRKKAYLVATPIDGGAGRAIGAGGACTMRIDRIVRASAERGVEVEVPSDFDPTEHIKLPFQLGPVTCEARFAVPPGASRALSVDAGGKGSFDNPDSPTTWAVEVSDLDGAAAWAIAEGIRPLAPQPLVEAWKKRLEEVAAHA